MRVNGLLMKAQTLRRHLRLLGPDELRADDDKAISPEEREKILSQIEEAVGRSRMKITPDTFLFKPRKRGSVLPLIVNAAALVVLVAGVSGAVLLSRRSEQTIIAAPVTLLTAEGKMVAALKEQARQQLEGKDKEIASIRERLAGMDQERARIRQEADAAVRQREQELQDSLDKSLAAQRAKLSASGLSEDAVARRISDFETKSRAALDAQLATFRTQSEADRAEKERTIEKLQAEYQQTLAAAQADRTKAQEEAARRQSELEAGSQQKQLALEKDKAAALAELEKLRQQQGKEQLVLDQFLSYYQKAREQIQAAQPGAARKVLADFRTYLDDPDLATLPGIVRRRPVELFLIDSLDQLIRAQAAPAGDTQNVQALVASANLISSVSALVQQGDAQFQVQGYEKARELYLSALAQIPSTQAGYEKLGEIEKIFAVQKKKEVATLMAAGNASYKSGNYDAAVQSYGKALEMLQGERGTVDALISQLTDIGALRKASQAAAQKGPEGDAAARARSAAMLAGLRARLTAAGAAAGNPANERDTLVALLETKLLMQKTLLSADVVKQYPDLYDRLNKYLDALAAESRADARLETLRDMDTLLGAVAGRAGPGAADSLVQRYTAADPRGILLSILDRLQSLLK
ncbi:MAG: hypothetical protein ABSB63_05460 [Spirochaetia bacterium]